MDSLRRGSVVALGTYTDKNLGLKSLKNLENLGNQRLKAFQTVTFSQKNDDRDRQRFQVLVGGQHCVKFGGGLLKKRPVAQTGPAHLSHRTNIVAYQQERQRPG